MLFCARYFTTSQQSMINNEAIQVEELIVYGDKNMNRVAKQFSDQNNLTSFGKISGAKRITENHPLRNY